MRNRRRAALVPRKNVKRAGVLVGREKRRRPALLGHPKAVKSRGHKGLRGYLAPADGIDRNANDSGTRRLAIRSKYVRRHIKRIGADRDVREVEELAGNAKHSRGYVEETPVPGPDISGRGESEALDVIGLRARLRTVLQQPDERID